MAKGPVRRSAGPAPCRAAGEPQPVASGARAGDGLGGRALLALHRVEFDALTLGDLCESVMKRDLGIKDMSQVIPGHGGLMDRLDSLLATVAPIWLVLYYLVY